MVKTYKIIVCGKKSTGKTTILESLIYNRDLETYYPTIEDIYLGYWEKEKNQREKIRFYDTKGLSNSSDNDTLNSIKYLFSSLDGAILVFSSQDNDSISCIDKLKSEIERSKDKKEICHFIAIDFDFGNLTSSTTTIANSIPNYEFLQNQLKLPIYRVSNENKREMLCDVFNELAKNMTQIVTKNSMNLPTIKKPKILK